MKIQEGLLKTLNLIRRKKPRHLILTGPSFSGIDLLSRALETHTGLKAQNIPALDKRTLSRTSITKAPFDILEIEKIKAALEDLENLLFVVILQHPATLLCQKLALLPQQHFFSYDYSFLISDEVKSLSRPGIAAFNRVVENLYFTSRDRALVIHYEQLIGSKHLLYEQTVELGRWLSGSPIDKKKSLCCHDVGEQLCLHLSEECLERLYIQNKLFPDFSRTVKLFGYPFFKTSAGIDHFTSSERGTVILFYTDNAIYRREAERCIKSLERIGLKYDVTVLPHRSSWEENCAMKPKVLLDARRRLSGRLLYMDVDAVVHRDPWPYLNLYNGDLAVYVHDNGEFWTGTIFIEDTFGARNLLQEWLRRQKKEPQKWDQRVLQEIIEEDEAGAKSRFLVQRLIPNFTYIFDRSYRYIYGEPIIEHLQVSRETAHKENIIGLHRRKKRLEELEKNL